MSRKSHELCAAASRRSDRMVAALEAGVRLSDAVAVTPHAHIRGVITGINGQIDGLADSRVVRGIDRRVDQGNVIVPEFTSRPPTARGRAQDGLEPAAPVASNLLARRVAIEEHPEPDRTSCADSTYVPARKGRLFITVPPDLSRRRGREREAEDAGYGPAVSGAAHGDRGSPDSVLLHVRREPCWLCRAPLLRGSGASGNPGAVQVHPISRSRAARSRARSIDMAGLNVGTTALTSSGVGSLMYWRWESGMKGGRLST